MLAGWTGTLQASHERLIQARCNLSRMLQQPLSNAPVATLKTMSVVLLHRLPLEPPAPGHPYTDEGLKSCREYLQIIVMQCPPERPVYLLGESFGGVMALAVAEARPDLVRPTHEITEANVAVHLHRDTRALQS